MNNYQTKAQGVTTTYDEGLRTHFRHVYNVMCLGLAVTGAVAYGIANWPAAMQFIFGTPFQWVVMLAPMAFVFFGFSHKSIMTKTPGQLKTLFVLFSAVFGMSLSAIFYAYTGADIARAFFITAATFATMSVWGYTTKSDLSKLGSFLFMGVIGLLIAIVVNWFLQSTMLDFIISAAGVLIYTLMTAFDTQNIKESYNVANGDDANQKMAVMGALSLYINFIMLLQFILQFVGNRD